MEAEEIKRYYSEWHENPKDIRSLVFERLNEYIKQRIPRGNGKKALDIGSGHGRIISYLLEKGYKVTAIEFNEKFVDGLRRKFPEVKVVSGDALKVEFKEKYDLVTCIEFTQVLGQSQLSHFLSRLAEVCNLLLVNISNRNSLHSQWVKFRGWQNEFVFGSTPEEFDKLLMNSGFDITHKRGIGLITPISMFRDFRGKLVPFWIANAINTLDPLLAKICHLYYVEAISQREQTMLEGKVEKPRSPSGCICVECGGFATRGSMAHPYCAGCFRKVWKDDYDDYFEWLRKTHE